jgi:hypothetical protein
MATTCRAFHTEDDARAHVERLLAAGTSGDDIRVDALHHGRVLVLSR